MAPRGVELPNAAVTAGSVDFPDIGSDTLIRPVDLNSVRFSAVGDATLFAFRSVRVVDDHVLDADCFGIIEPGPASANAPATKSTSMGCAPSIFRNIAPDVSFGSVHTDGQPDTGRWQWSNVPLDTDFVQFEDGNVLTWQRPVNGMVSFPTTSQNLISTVVATAYRADGAVLGTVDASAILASPAAEQAVLPYWMTGSVLPNTQLAAAANLATNAFADCLTAIGAGATVQPTVNPGAARFFDLAHLANPAATWQECVNKAQTTLDTFIKATIANTSVPETTPIPDTTPVTTAGQAS